MMKILESLESVETGDAIRGVVILLCVSTIVMCAVLAMVSRTELRNTRLVSIFRITMPAVSMYKLLGLFGMLLVPTAAVSLGAYQMLEGNKEMNACVRCHVMRPMAVDMEDPQSETLAAKHYRNKWIADEQCFHCHTDYGFSGTIEAKLTGLRHLLVYTSRTYHEPIQLGKPFNNRNCMHCHGGTPKYDNAEMHGVMAESIVSNETSCTSCHGEPHPSRDKRTPGNPDYESLMRVPEVSR